VYAGLNSLVKECASKQAVFGFNSKISDLILKIQTFKAKGDSVDLALKNIDNVIFETNKGTFANMNEA